MSWKCIKCGGDTSVFRTEQVRRGWATRGIKRTHKCKSCAAELVTMERIYDGAEVMAQHVERNRQSTMGESLSKLSATVESQKKEIARLKRELKSTPAARGAELSRIERAAVEFERRAEARKRVEERIDMRDVDAMCAPGYA